MHLARVKGTGLIIYVVYIYEMPLGGTAKLRKVEEILCVEDLVGYKFHRGWRSVDGGTAGHLPDSGLLEVEYAVGQHVHDGQQAQRILHAPCHAERLEAIIRACLALYCQEE